MMVTGAAQMNFSQENIKQVSETQSPVLTGVHSNALSLPIYVYSNGLLSRSPFLCSLRDNNYNASQKYSQPEQTFKLSSFKIKIHLRSSVLKSIVSVYSLPY